MQRQLPFVLVLLIAGLGGLVGYYVMRQTMEPPPPDASSEETRGRKVERFPTRPSPYADPSEPSPGSAETVPGNEAEPHDELGMPPRAEPPDPDAADDDRENEPPVRHPITPEGLKAAIAGQKPELKACYDTLLESYPDVAGRITVGFTVGPDGRVTEADVEDATMDSLYLEGCIVTAMEDVRFEEAANGLDETRVSYPFVFDTD